MCHALRARALSVMAARVRLKMRRGTGVSPLAVLLAMCAVLAPVSGMFEHRHCDHQHPRAHEVSAKYSRAKGDSNLSTLLRLRHSSPSFPNCAHTRLASRISCLEPSLVFSRSNRAFLVPVHAERVFILPKGTLGRWIRSSLLAVVCSHVFVPSFSCSRCAIAARLTFNATFKYF